MVLLGLAACSGVGAALRANVEHWLDAAVQQDYGTARTLSRNSDLQFMVWQGTND